MIMQPRAVPHPTRSPATGVGAVTDPVRAQDRSVGINPDRTDDQLLMAASEGDGEAFGLFYRRHLPAVVAFVRPRCGSGEAAADLVAEVFAAALLACARYRPGEAPALLWLLGIARNKLREHARDSRRRASARARLGIREVAFTEDDLSRVEELAAAGSAVLKHIAELPEEQRRAIWSRVVEEHDYLTLARDLDTSQALARQRVSRGLRWLRARLESER